jgi:acyl carrier protein
MTDHITRLRAIVAEQLGMTDNPGRISPDASFEDDLGADSIDIIDLIMSVEDAFGIEIPEDDDDTIRDGTFGRLCEVVEAKLGAKVA